MVCAHVNSFLLNGGSDSGSDARSAHGVASSELLAHPVRDRSRTNAKCHESAIPQVLHQQNGVARGLNAKLYEQKSRHRPTMKIVDPVLPAEKMQGHLWEHFCPYTPDSIVASGDPR